MYICTNKLYRKKIMNVKMIERFTISLLVRVKMSSAG